MLSTIRRMVTILAVMLVSQQALATTITVAQTTGNQVSITLGAPSSIYHNWEDLQRRKSTESGWTNLSMRSTDTPPSSGTWYYRARQVFRASFNGYPSVNYGDFVQDSVTLASAPPKPSISASTTSSTSGNYSISWSASSGATSYQWKENSGSWQTVSSSTRSRSFSNKANGSYTYSVRACNSVCSASSSVTVSVVDTPAQISISPTTSTNGSYTISFSGGKVKGSTSGFYNKLQEKAPGGSFVDIGNHSSPVTRTGKAQGTWQYRLKSCVVEVTGGPIYGPPPEYCTGYSSTKSVTVNYPVPAKVGNLTLGDSEGTYDTDGRIDVSWSAISGATKYQIRYGKSGSSKSTIDNTSTSRSFTSLSDGTWEFETRACNVANECGSWSNKASKEVRRAPSTPTNFKVSENPSADGTYSISWSKPSGVVNTYEWRTRTNSGSWSGVTSQTGLNKSFTKTSQATYRYQVRACRSGGICSGFTSEVSTVVDFPTPPKVGNLTLGDSEGTHDTDGRIDLSWYGVSNATKYQIRYGKSGSSKTTIDNTSTSRSFTGLSNGTWEFEVRACNRVNECSILWSNKASKTVSLPPAAPTVSASTTESNSGSYSISWTASTGATSYQWKEVNYSGGNTSGEWKSVSASTRSVSVTGKAAGVYVYYVKACSAACSDENAVTVAVVKAKLAISTTYSEDGFYSVNGEAHFNANENEFVQLIETGPNGQKTYNGATSMSFTKFESGEWSYRLQICKVNSGQNSAGVQCNLGMSNVVNVEVALPEMNADEVLVDNEEFTYAVDETGTLEGSFSVSNSGSAQYVIPIPEAPGTNGMTPNLNVRYDSTSGNGTMGIGWYLSGLSEISRCAKTEAIDGEARAVDWSETDVFCLDGTRLIRLDEEDRTYFDHNDVREYRTANDQFSRIISFEHSQAGPHYFKVWTKSGEIHEYGVTNNSRILSATGQEANSVFNAKWALNKKLDRHGNYIEYNYFHGGRPNSPYVNVNAYLPKSIRYTGNDTQGVIPYNEIRFTYQDRYDKSVENKTGKFKSDYRLRKIEHYQDGVLSNKQVIEYAETGVQKSSIVKEILHCDYNDLCLAPTRLSWSKEDTSPAGYSTPESIGTLMYYEDVTYKSLYQSTIQTGDFNGDGITDIYQNSFNGNSRIHFFGNDGTIDFSRTGFSNETHQLPTRSGIPYASEHINRASTYLSRTKFGDFNGDGITDVYYFVGGYPNEGSVDIDKLYLFNPDGSFSEKDGYSTIVGATNYVPTQGTSWANIYLASYKVGDFNNDGISDIFYTPTDDISTIIFFDEDGNPTTQDTVRLPIESPNIYAVHHAMDKARTIIVDFNGDGVSDIYRVRGFGEPNETEENGFRDPDFIDEIILLRENGSILKKIEGAYTRISDKVVGEVYEDISRIHFGDFNGDGIKDIFVKKGFVENFPKPYVVGYDIHLFNDNVYYYNANGEYTVESLYTTNGAHLALPFFNTMHLASSISNCRDHAEAYIGSTVSDQNKACDELGGRLPIYGVDTMRYKFMDFNGDGTTDISYIPHNGSRVKDYLFYFNRFKRVLETQEGPNTQVYYPSNIINARFPTNERQIDNWYSTQFDLSRYRYGDFNGDGFTDILEVGTGEASYIYFNQEKKVLLEEITNGFGAQTKITYSSLTNKNVYVREVPSQAQERAVQNTSYVVSSYDSSDGLGGFRNYAYQYKGMKVDEKQRNQGFREIIVTDNTHQEGFVTSTEFFQAFPYTGLVKNKLVKKKDGKKISETTAVTPKAIYTIAGGATPTYPYFVYEESSASYTYDLETEARLTSRSFYQGYDNLGNLTSESNKYVDEFGSYVTDTYNDYNDEKTEDWLLGRATESRVVKTITPSTDQPADTRENSISTTYYSDANLPMLVTHEPNTSIALSTRYDYDNFGNIETTSVCGGDSCSSSNSGARVTETSYDTRGQFPQSTLNPELHETTYEYHASFGLATKTTDADDISSCVKYDTFGRVLESRAYCGSGAELLTTTSYESAEGEDNSFNDQMRYKVIVDTPHSGTTQVYFDVLKRKIRETQESFNGKQINIDYAFDSRGRATHLSEPYFDEESGSRAWNVSQYDALDRVTKLTPADGTTPRDTDYEGLSKTVKREVDGVLRETVTHINALGQVIEITDAHEESTQYQYNALGLIQKTIDPHNNEIVLGYDNRGRRTSINDPDMGYWSYTYTPFGEIETQTDAKGIVTFMRYDDLGRMRERIFDYGGNNSETETWAYDSGNGAGAGKLHTVENDKGYGKTYDYDNYGRVRRAHESIPQASGSTRTYTTGWRYNDHSRVRYVDYPEDFSIRYHYSTQNGQIKRVSSEDNTFDYWTLVNTNARGQAIEENFGNGVETTRWHNPSNGWLDRTRSFSGANTIHDMEYDFDEAGNILWREDHVRNLREEFTLYDKLDRIREVTFNGQTREYQYDALGNITNKWDTGSYNYTDNSGCGYSGYTPGPHAVRSITGPQGSGICYDRNGNMVSNSMNNGDVDVVEYTVDNRPERFLRNNVEVARFDYSPLGNRYRKITQDKTLYYIGQDEVGKVLYEREEQGSTVKHKNYIYGNGLALAVVEQNSSGAVTNEFYQLRDHLNSVEVITDRNGEVVVNKSFDVWGRPRSEGDWSALGNFQVKDQLGFRGFTDHEHIDETGLIHMNGRVYNPIIGRFLTPDPTIPFAEVQQSYNRYSYVRNNPLKYTDPTGYKEDLLQQSTQQEQQKVEEEVIVIGESEDSGKTEKTTELSSSDNTVTNVGASGASQTSVGNTSNNTDDRPNFEGAVFYTGGINFQFSNENAQEANNEAKGLGLEIAIELSPIGIAIDIAKDIKNGKPPNLVDLATKRIKTVKKLFSKAKGAAKKADFIVDSNGTAVRNSTSGARKDLETGGFPGTKSTETLENGTIHRGVPGKDGPMDVRIMDGQSNGNAFKGPRIRTTRSGSANDGVRSDGSRFRNNESKSERLRDSHIHF